MKTKLLATLMAVGLALTGMVGTATPASANWGTDVVLVQVSGEAPVNPNAWIKARNMLGTDKILHLGETAHNVARFGPPSENYQMAITGPAGTTTVTDPGESYVPSKDGQYEVHLYILN